MPIKKHLVTPLLPSTSVTYYPLVDLQFRGYYASLAFCFRDRLDPERMLAALRQVLSDFPECAGRLRFRRAGPTIEHGRGAALLEVVEDGSTLAELEAATTRGDRGRLCPAVTSIGVALNSLPMFGVRLTLGSDGSAVGITWCHQVGDMQTFVLLMRAWAHAYRDEPYEKPVAILDREAYVTKQIPDPPCVPSGLFVGRWRDSVGMFIELAKPALITDLHFSWEQVASLRTRFGLDERTTAYNVLSAHVFYNLRALYRPARPANICSVVNYRKRVGFAANVPGNLTALVSYRAQAEDDEAAIALGLRKTIRDFATCHVDYHATRRTLSLARGVERLRFCSRHFMPGSGDLLMTDWTNFGNYELTFESGGPTLFRDLTPMTPWSARMVERAADSGLTVRISLPRPLARRVAAQHELDPLGRA